MIRPDLGLHSLSRHFWQTTIVQNLRYTVNILMANTGRTNRDDPEVV